MTTEDLAQKRIELAHQEATMMLMNEVKGMIETGGDPAVLDEQRQSMHLWLQGAARTRNRMLADPTVSKAENDAWVSMMTHATMSGAWVPRGGIN